MATLLVAATLGAVVGIQPRLLLVVAGGCVFAAVYWRLSAHIGLLLALVVPTLLGSLLVPRPVSSLAEAVLIVAPIWWLFIRRKSWGRVEIAAAFAIAVIAWWCLNLLNPNVPSPVTGVLGIRKATLWFAGLAFGLLAASRLRKGASETVIRLMCACGFALIFVHLVLPGLESSFSRAAGEYTSQFRGATRMQGFFPGPFHVSELGAFLTIWGLHGFVSRNHSPVITATYLGAGVALLALASVRTGYVAAAIGIALVLLVRPAPGQPRTRGLWRVGLVVSAVAIGIGSGALTNSATSSLSGLAQDQRATGRIGSWTESIAVVRESLIVGWGPGSGATASDAAFTGFVHVTTHSAPLSYLVEGGAVGGLLVAALAIALFGLVRRRWSLDNPALAAISVVVVFGAFGEVSESIPVSVLLMLIIGLECGRPADPDADDVVPDGRAKTRVPRARGLIEHSRGARTEK